MAQVVNSPRLPWELIDTILDELASDGIHSEERSNALCSCALVCHRFHFIASGYIFSKIVVVEIKSDLQVAERLKSLYHIFLKNNSIAPRVHHFTIDTVSFFCSVGPRPKSDIRVLATREYLPYIMSSLSSIRHFGWINRNGPVAWTYSSHPVWAPLCLEIRIAVEGVLKCPSLYSLTLQGLSHLDPTILTYCKNLKHLELKYVSQANEYPRQRWTVPFDTALRLQSLTYCGSKNMLYDYDDPKPPKMTSQLRHLRVFHDIRTGWLLMQSASKTLEILDIQDMTGLREPTQLPGSINISILEKLHTLKISCRLGNGRRGDDIELFPAEVVNLLGTSKSSTTIKDLYINIHWKEGLHGTQSFRFRGEPDWTDLDDILSQTDIFPELRTVEFQLKLEFGEWFDLSDPSKQSPRVKELSDRVKRTAGGWLRRTSASQSVCVTSHVTLYNDRGPRVEF